MTRRFQLTGAAALLLGVRGAHAQQSAARQPTAPPPAAHYRAATLARLADTLAAQHVPGRVLGDRGSYQYVLVRRDTSGTAEVHARWTDVMIVQAGGATVRTGGRMADVQEISPGEERGRTLAGGTTTRVGPGDLLVIPAGLPHQVELARGESIRYIVVKAPEPGSPPR
jgi:mannose-6-phosphate isomerase-like protein (cupin superfamily)